LRFELKPVGETQKLLNENKVFNKDKIVNESYNKIKPYLDKLHIKFIEESLKNLHMDFLEVEEKYLEWQKETDKNKKNKLKKELF
jgi:CRISPR-associated protein Cpf1